MNKYIFDAGGSTDDYINQLANQYNQDQTSDDNVTYEFDDGLDGDSQTYLDSLREQADEEDAENEQSTAIETKVQDILNKFISHYEDKMNKYDEDGLWNDFLSSDDGLDYMDRLYNPNDETTDKSLALGEISAQATKYGYGSDPYGDSNSLKGIGNRNNKLTPNTSVALSKRTASKIGAKAGDKIQVTLPSGEKRIVTYDDTVPNGYNNDRIDFYTPSGKLDIDGKNVKIKKV